MLIAILVVGRMSEKAAESDHGWTAIIGTPGQATANGDRFDQRLIDNSLPLESRGRLPQ